MPGLTFAKLRAADLLAIRLQPSQRTVLGMDATATPEFAEQMAAQAVAWSVFRGSDLLACIGIAETVPGSVGTAWAVLTEGLGESHLELTRFLRRIGAECPLPRIEALARAADLEPTLAAFPDLDTGQIVALAMKWPTPECRWARMVGLRPAHLLRCYGATGESMMLFERILPVSNIERMAA